MSSLGYAGKQRSYSFGCFHADKVPNSNAAVEMPNMPCEQVFVQNDPDSSGNAYIGWTRLGTVGTGYVLEPGDVTGWIPVENLNMLWHKELNDTTYLNYMAIVDCSSVYGATPFHLLLENRSYILLEDGNRIYL